MTTSHTADSRDGTPGGPSPDADAHAHTDADAHTDAMPLDHHQVAVHRSGTGSRRLAFCHPAPGSGGFDPDPATRERLGVTLVGVDRPGYGGTPPARDHWSTPATAADQLAAVLRADPRAAGPVGVVGWSAGGRVALALAARHPELVDAVAVIATPAPDEEVPWLPAEQRAGLAALRGLAPGEVHALLATQLGGLVPAGDGAGPDPAELAAAALADSPGRGPFAVLGAGPADADVVVPGPGLDALAGMVAGAWRQGAAGVAADIAGYCLSPWGFDPRDVKAPVRLLYGGGDPLVPAEHGRWWARQLADARLEVVEGGGHLLAVPAWGRILEYLTTAGPRAGQATNPVLRLHPPQS